jgi:hypothetical protein
VIRRLIETALPILGTAKIFFAVLFLHKPAFQLPAVAIGLLFIHARMWNLAQPVLPSERKFQALRREVDHFILLVRRLNAAALGVKQIDTAATRAVFETERQRMRESFDRMAMLAGRTDDEVAAMNLGAIPALAD